MHPAILEHGPDILQPVSPGLNGLMESGSGELQSWLPNKGKIPQPGDILSGEGAVSSELGPVAEDILSNVVIGVGDAKPVVGATYTV